jgi:phage anti-repressor protein
VIIALFSKSKKNFKIKKNFQNQKYMETKLEDFIAKRSDIPKDFLKDFFNLGGNTYGDTYKNINFDDIVKWLGMRKHNLKRLLVAHFNIMDDYTEKKTLVTTKKGGNYVSKIMLTPDCFKELCMLSKSEKAKGVRKYYIVAEGLLRDHFEEIIENLNIELGLIRNNIKKPKEIIGGNIYIIKAMNTTIKNMFKIGNTDDMKKRLRVYNTGNANNIEPLFIMKVDDINMVEGCIKNISKKYQYKKNKEVYNIDFEFLQKLCLKCKNFIKQIQKEYVIDKKTTQTNLKKIKNNKNNSENSFFMIIDKT